jgi:hypothetical protein
LGITPDAAPHRQEVLSSVLQKKLL